MKFGPIPPRKLPQQDPARVLMLAERWQRSAFAQARWAERAKRAVDFFEGRQWSEEHLRTLARGRRPALTFNIIAPLVRLVLGYNASNKSDITFLPGQDLRASEQTAEVLTRLEKVIAEESHLPFVDTEVFMDGLICGRGFYETLLDFETNDLGEVRTGAYDPFSVYLDPDASTYDLNGDHSFVAKSKFVSIDEIEATYGSEAAKLIQPFMLGQTPVAPLSSLPIADEISPMRTFGERHDSELPFWDEFYSLMGDFVDTRRRTIRLIEFEHKIVEPKTVIIDLETGDKVVCPDSWGPEQIQKCLLYGELVGGMTTKNPLRAQRRMCERLQWTTMVADLLLYDAPSLYEGYTLTSYFPYFRRGFTRGMVEDLIDPQIEKNKRKSARIEIVSKSANGGWKVHEDAMTPEQERNLQKFGSSAGVIVKWRGDREPEQIMPNVAPVAHRQLEEDADDDIKHIAGINDSSLGQPGKVKSGRAVQAEQRQAVLGIQMYLDNFNRSKELLGSTHISIIQHHYTEPRIYRIMGKDGHFSQVMLNMQQRNAVTGVTEVVNDVTLGKYQVVIDRSPLADSFLEAQFQEMLHIVQLMGPALNHFMPMFADLILDMSSMPRKDEWIARIKAVAQQANQQAAQQHQQPQPQPQPHPQPHPQAHQAVHPHQPANPTVLQPSALGGGPVAQNIVPFTHTLQHNAG